jgi:hypothetical protein
MLSTILPKAQMQKWLRLPGNLVSPGAACVVVCPALDPKPVAHPPIPGCWLLKRLRCAGTLIDLTHQPCRSAGLDYRRCKPHLTLSG